MKKRIYTIIVSGLILVSVTGALSACGGGAKSTASYDAVYETTAAAAAETMAAMPGEGAPDSSASDGGLTSGSATLPVQPVGTARKLIRTVNLDVETTEFDSLLDTITQTVTSMGGYLEQSDISGNSISASQGNRRYAYLTARIPSDKLDSFVSQVDENGNIINKSENTQDVTLQYSDIESHKKTLAVEQDRLWELLARADSMDAIIALESRLSDIRYQLESFESQLRTYDNQVDYSSVYLNINEVKVFTPTAPDSVLTRIQKGFSRNLQGVGNGMVDFFVWLIASLPILLVCAVLAALAAVIALSLRRLIRRKTRTEAKKDDTERQNQQNL